MKTTIASLFILGLLLPALSAQLTYYDNGYPPAPASRIRSIAKNGALRNGALQQTTVEDTPYAEELQDPVTTQRPSRNGNGYGQQPVSSRNGNGYSRSANGNGYSRNGYGNGASLQVVQSYDEGPVDQTIDDVTPPQPLVVNGLTDAPLPLQEDVSTETDLPLTTASLEDTTGYSTEYDSPYTNGNGIATQRPVNGYSNGLKAANGYNGYNGRKTTNGNGLKVNGNGLKKTNGNGNGQKQLRVNGNGYASGNGNGGYSNGGYANEIRATNGYNGNGRKTINGNGRKTSNGNGVRKANGNGNGLKQVKINGGYGNGGYSNGGYANGNGNGNGNANALKVNGYNGNGRKNGNGNGQKKINGYNGQSQLKVNGGYGNGNGNGGYGVTDYSSAQRVNGNGYANGVTTVQPLNGGYNGGQAVNGGYNGGYGANGNGVTQRATDVPAEGLTDDHGADHDDHHGSGDPIQWLRDAIRGEPGADYPIFYTPPETAFKCSEQQWPGYYADVEARCQVFHICQADGRSDAFLCPNGTVFSQRNFVCVWWFDFDCNSSPEFFSLNAQLYQEGGYGDGAQPQQQLNGYSDNQLQTNGYTDSQLQTNGYTDSALPLQEDVSTETDLPLTTDSYDDTSSFSTEYDSPYVNGNGYAAQRTVIGTGYTNGGQKVANGNGNGKRVTNGYNGNGNGKKTINGNGYSNGGLKAANGNGQRTVNGNGYSNGNGSAPKQLKVNGNGYNGNGRKY